MRACLRLCLFLSVFVWLGMSTKQVCLPARCTAPRVPHVPLCASWQAEYSTLHDPHPHVDTTVVERRHHTLPQHSTHVLPLPIEHLAATSSTLIILDSMHTYLG
jgi:hypothetical protein